MAGGRHAQTARYIGDLVVIVTFGGYLHTTTRLHRSLTMADGSTNQSAISRRLRLSAECLYYSFKIFLPTFYLMLP